MGNKQSTTNGGKSNGKKYQEANEKGGDEEDKSKGNVSRHNQGEDKSKSMLIEQHDNPGGFSEAVGGQVLENKEDEVDFVKDDVENKGRLKETQALAIKRADETMKNEDDGETYTRTNKKKTGNDIAFIQTCLKSHFVFYNHSEAELQNIVEKMFFCSIEKNEILFKHGSNANCFFIIESGALEVIVNGKPKRELKRGDGFGELALLYNAPRSATIKAAESTNMWAIDRNTYRKAVEEIITKEYEDNRKFLDAVKFFDSMTIEQKDAIAGVLITQRYSKGQLIVSEGDPASSFYIIKEGTVSVLKGNTEVRKLPKGNSFGEQALYYNTVRQMSVKAVDDVKVLALGRDTVTKVLGDQIHVITFKNIQKWALEKNILLSKLTKSQIDKIVDNMKIINYKGGDTLFNRQTPCNKLVMVVEGTLKKSRIGTIVATKGLVYGEEYLVENNRGPVKNLDDDIILENDGVIAEIGFESLENLIGGKLEEVIKKNEEKYPNIINNHKNDLIKTREEVRELNISYFLYLKKLRPGQFGPVYLVRCNEVPEIFVCKCIEKSLVTDLSVDKFFIVSSVFTYPS